MTKLQAKKIKFYKKQYYQMIKRHNALLKKVTKGVAQPIARGSTTNKASKIGGGYAESLGRFF